MAEPEPQSSILVQANSSAEAFLRLNEIIKKLRGPDGCSWDRAQTPKSMIPYLLEETYEVIETLEEGNIDGLQGELGDLFFLVLLEVRMAEEAGQFQLGAVLNEICEKLIRRHPHVFHPDENAANPGVEEILHNWDRIKMSEGRKSRLDGVPKNLSGLIRAQRIQEKASQVGFDWDDLAPVVDKLHEEIDELLTANRTQGPEQIEEELGDVLFSVVNVARFVGVDAETAMRHAVEKFNSRFRAVEEIFRQEGREMEGSTLTELDEVWDRVKGNLH